MGCGCINRELSNYDRIRKLAIAFAKGEGVNCVIYQCHDSSYNFSIIGEEKGKVIEIITKYYDRKIV